MQFLKNIWYVACFIEELEQNGFVARRVADTPLLLMRAADGAPAAMRDRCPHRQAPLSRGKIESGVVQCGYHGLTFDATGACIHNPYDPVVDALKVRSFPAAEAYGMVWVWMGDPASADAATIPDLSPARTEPACASFQGYIVADANHQLLVDNILDLSHADYLHADTLGGVTPTRPKVSEQGNAVVAHWESVQVPAMPIHQPYLPKPDMLVDSWTTVRWYPGGAMLLSQGTVVPGKPAEEGLISHSTHIMTPQTADTSHYFYRIWRNWEQQNEDYKQLLIGGINKAFGQEDKPMIEAQQRNLEGHGIQDFSPVMLPIDVAPERARRLYSKLLAAEAESA